MRHTTLSLPTTSTPRSFSLCHGTVCFQFSSIVNPPGKLLLSMAFPRWRRPYSKQQTALQSSFAPPVHSDTKPASNSAVVQWSMTCQQARSYIPLTSGCTCLGGGGLAGAKGYTSTGSPQGGMLWNYIHTYTYTYIHTYIHT